MAGVPVTITGVLIDLYGRTISGPCKLVGELVRSDREIGGGPIIPPPDEKPPNGDRPGIWPKPGDPDYPIKPPPVDPPIDPPTDPPVGIVVKPPPPGGGWGFTSPYGWAYFPKEGQAGPK